MDMFNRSELYSLVSTSCSLSKKYSCKYEGWSFDGSKSFI